QLVEYLIERQASCLVAIRPDELEQTVDHVVQPAGFLLDDRGTLQCSRRVAAPDPHLQHLEVDHDRVERVLDFMSEVVGQTTHELEAVRPELLVIEWRKVWVHESTLVNLAKEAADSCTKHSRATWTARDRARSGGRA